MSLTKCKVCNGQVAITASACPHCGVPSPGVSDELIEIATKRVGFLQARWFAGLVFWPGVVWLLIPVFTNDSGDEFLQHWQLSKWLIGYGALHYIASEIDRNLFERRARKKQIK
jgi:hypothetical protein